jgi:hypothetical protein
MANKTIAPAGDFADAFRAMEQDLEDRSLFDAYYVERRHSPAGRLKVALETGSEPCKILYSGQNKSGKTTELLRLVHSLEDTHLVVFLSVLRDMEPGDVQALDVLLLSAAKLCGQARDAGIKLGRDIEKLMSDLLLQSTSDVFRTRVTEKAGGGGADITLPLAIVELGGNFRIDSSLRSEVRQKLEPRVGQLVEVFDMVADKVRQSGRQPLVIIDDMEKIDVEPAEKLFRFHAATLTRPRCRMIYTVHKAMEYLPSWNSIRSSFDDSVEVYPVRIRKRDGTAHEEGLELLRSIIRHRMKEDLFEPDAFKQVVCCCNGVLSDLLSLCRGTCLTAIEVETERITYNMVDRHWQDLTINYQRMIDESLYPKVADVAKTKEGKKDETLSKLLHMLAVIEYRDEDGIYYDVHPAVKPLLVRRHLV